MAICNPKHYRVSGYVQFTGYKVDRENLLEVALYMGANTVVREVTGDAYIEFEGQKIQLGDFVFKMANGHVMVICAELFAIMFEEVQDVAADILWWYQSNGDRTYEALRQLEDDGK